ncbi:MAG: zinc-ribbon domain-containing protein [Candidatus Heimdallarchaeota archaeon]|nr:zinc-ribbon domain-containing protein [Candidatus Heimdallarchaeota archaeon]
MAYCNNCGTEHQNDEKFCRDCGEPIQLQSQEQQISQPTQQSMQQNYQQPVMNDHYQPQMMQENYFRPTEYQVEQKLLSVKQTYKIKDVNGIDFMVAKRSLTSWVRPKFTIENVLGEQIGFIQSNFWRTEWVIYDNQSNVHGTVIFPFIMWFTKSFVVETPIGLFRSGESVFSKRFDCYAPDGRLSFVVDKKLISLRDKFKIQSNDQLGPFVTCLAAVVIDQKFHQKNN